MSRYIVGSGGGFLYGTLRHQNQGTRIFQRHISVTFYHLNLFPPVKKLPSNRLRQLGSLSFSKRPSAPLKHHSIRQNRNFSQTSKENSDSVDDLCKKFRQPKLGEELWYQLFAETQKTQNFIQRPLYDSLVEEIQTEVSIQPPVGLELGPTGKYRYGMSDDMEKCLRTYRRWKYNSNNDTQLEDSEEIVFDINFHEMQIGSVSLSVDENFVAYLVTPTSQGENSSETQAWVRNIASKEAKMLVSGPIGNIEFGPIKDGKHTIFYSTMNSLGRADTIHACTIVMNGMSPSVPSIIYQNNDEATMVDMQRTKGCHYVGIHATTKTSNEIRLVSAIDEKPLLVRARQEGVMYHIDVGKDQDIFILASATTERILNSGLGEELSIFQTNVANLPLVGTFGEKVKDGTAANCNKQFVVNDMELFRDFIAFYESSVVDGHQQIRILNRNRDSESTIIPLPLANACTSISPCGNMFYDATCLCFGIESPVERSEFYKYDSITKTLLSLFPEDQDGVGEEQAQENIVHKRVLVESQDGTSVPLSMVYRNDVAPSLKSERGQEIRPTILSAYGAYGQPLSMCFDPTLVPLLNKGFVLAFAHIRGGGDCGRSWYERGRLYEKQRSVEDYIACAQALTGQLQITEPHLLTAKAFSAGGVAVGAAVNQMPFLFGNVIISNGFLDVMTAMADSTLPLTEHEWEEWGNPLTDQLARRTISQYCPMSNIKRQKYPRMLLIGTLDDENVPFWHPLTFALKIRHSMTNKSETAILLHIETQGGHHLHGRLIHVSALANAFILQNYEHFLEK